MLPKRLEINIPPALTAVAEAAVGRDAVMRAVASAVLQADALEHALIAALPLGPQSAAGGVSLPDSFGVRLIPRCRDYGVYTVFQEVGSHLLAEVGIEQIRADILLKAKSSAWGREFGGQG